jgi:hypothetical protein
VTAILAFFFFNGMSEAETTTWTAVSPVGGAWSAVSAASGVWSNASAAGGTWTAVTPLED